MKTILTILALTLGFTGHAQAIEMPLIGLPVKASTASPVAKKVQAAQVKMRALGMGGGGIPYLCTGTKYECGLTGDPADTSPVVNADTGLRDIVAASGLYALDSSGNLYSRLKTIWATRPAGTAGETVAVHSTETGNTAFADWRVSKLCNTAVGAKPGYSSEQPTPYCNLPADLTQNDWFLRDTGVTGFFGGYIVGKMGWTYWDEVSGWYKGSLVYVLNGNPNQGVSTPLIFAAANSVVSTADTGIYIDNTGAAGDVSVTLSCNLSGSTFTSCPVNGSGDVQTVHAPLSLPADGFGTNKIVAGINGATVRFAPNLGTPVVFNIVSAQFGDGQVLEKLANANGYTRYAGRVGEGFTLAFHNGSLPDNILVTLPGTGTAKRLYVKQGLNAGNISMYLILETTTNESWQFSWDLNTNGPGSWTKL